VAGQNIIVQKKIVLNYSSLAASAAYEFVHVPALNVVHAREIIVNARVSQRNIPAGVTAGLFVRGFYPDPDDGGDIVGADIAGLAINLITAPATVPGIATTTLVNNIPAWIRIGTRFVQSSSPVNILITLAIDIVVRE
jgi:hypothetical protein